MLPLNLNLSQCKTFQYFMQMRAKSICEFWMPIEKGVQTPYFLVRNETERIPLRSEAHQAFGSIVEGAQAGVDAEAFHWSAMNFERHWRQRVAVALGRGQALIVTQAAERAHRKRVPSVRLDLRVAWICTSSIM